VRQATCRLSPVTFHLSSVTCHLPAVVRSTLWSYDIAGIDPRRDRELVITQVLNYGNWNGVRWLQRTYGASELRRVVKRPRRGMWWPRTLNYWLTILDTSIPKPVFDRAIIRMDVGRATGDR
jgi:hypothetical protein